MEAKILNDRDDIVRPNHCHVVRDPIGILISAIVYLLFAYLYFFTIYFGAWGYTFNKSQNEIFGSSRENAITNTVFFSLCYLMMVWSHIQTMITEAGFLPK